MPLLTSANIPSIRWRLDASLDEATLPDAVVVDQVPAAERLVLARDPLAATRTGDDLARVQEAAILFCAALLAPSVPRLTREETDGYRYQADVATWEELAATLRARAEAEIAAVLGPAKVSSRRPTFFARAPGYRGR
jgi:hypothetical protein